LSPFLLAEMYYIYILSSKKSDKYYIGLTSDVFKRLGQHNNPSVFSKYTSKHMPWELKVFFEVSESIGEAMIVERFIKNQKSRIFLEKLIEKKEDQIFFTTLINNILKRN
jgi:putative endonuclease